MKKRILALLLAAMMAVTFIAACTQDGGGGSTGGGSTDAGGSTGGGTTDTTTTGPGPVEGEMTAVGTLRSETLIVEFHMPIDTPGQFNTFMIGTSAGSGLHQLVSAHLYEIDTANGRQFPEVAADFPTQNADFTEHIMPIRDGIYWSDGVQLTAHDVAYTFNIIMDTPELGDNPFYVSTFKSVEAISDFEVKFVTHESFPRLATRFGVFLWGREMRILPKHIFENEDITSFTFTDLVSAGPYNVHSFDPMGTWILFELREDWERSTLGQVTGKKPQVPYVWFKNVSNDEMGRQMAIINNEVDLMMEVTPEQMDIISAQNAKIGAWYEDFPFATSDDPCSKGIAFQHAKEPYGNKYFRWGVALALNFDEVSLSIFDGIGRASPWPILTGTSAMQEMYVKPILPWLENLKITTPDGTDIYLWDGDYANRMGDILRAEGKPITTNQDELYDMFGYGWWAYDPDGATELFKMAGLELVDGNWFFDGEPFVINLTYLADTELQAGRGVTATYDQLIKFGFNCTIASESGTAFWENNTLGDWEMAGYWPTMFVTRDIANDILGWRDDLIVPLGERGSGQPTRWRNAESSELIREMSRLTPNDPRNFEAAQEWFKIAIEDLPFIGFHSGVKFVPYNATYFENYPTAANPYNGPWWWWSCFKYIVGELQPAS